MIIYLDIKDMILKETLSIYLAKYLGDRLNADVIISDYLQAAQGKRLVSIEDMPRPLDKDTLFQYLNIKKQNLTKQEQIQNLLNEYTQKILDVIDNDK